MSNHFENIEKIKKFYLGNTFVVTKHENCYALFVRWFCFIFAVAQKHHIDECN